MVLGESLAQTGELRLVNELQRPPDTLYPPGFPAVIAFWLKATGQAPGGVVIWVKLTQLLLLLVSLPLMVRLFERARLSRPYVAAALIAAAISPALIGYTNEVMSEIPFLLLCLGAIALVERKASAPDGELPAAGGDADGQDSEVADVSGVPDAVATNSEHAVGPALRIFSLAFAVGAFLVRTAALPLFLVQIVWFWKRYGWKWGAAALGVMLVCMGGWQMRNKRIIAHAPPGVHYSTYQDQFYLRDPMQPGAGRIRLRSFDLVERAVSGAATYTGMISRAYLNSMSVGTPWFWVFYTVAVPFTVLVLIGFLIGLRRGLWLSGAFTALFWFFTIMWPWRSGRFLVPLVPFFLLYASLGAEWSLDQLRKYGGQRAAQAVGVAAALVYVAYCGHVQANAIAAERKVTGSAYPLGRNKEEGGFYSACAWLKRNGDPGVVVMGRPAYLLHLYSGHPTTQLEPTIKPRGLEGYAVSHKVRYIVFDVWYWAHSGNYLNPYLAVYGDRWDKVWEDRLGSGVTVWRRRDAPLSPPAIPERKPGRAAGAVL